MALWKTKKLSVNLIGKKDCTNTQRNTLYCNSKALHCQMYHDWKKTKSLEDVETHFLHIQGWWYTIGATTDHSLSALQSWLDWWQFHFQQ